MVSVPNVESPLILLVEDQEETYEIVAELLVTRRYRVIGARNGIDAVDSAVKLLPTLILMDLSLPLMGGCEAARLLKSDARTSHIPIVALTGHTGFGAQAQQAGCDAFLTKPCSAERLLGEVERIVGPAAATTHH